MTPIPIDAANARNLYQPVRPNAHKGSQGHALLIGGSYGKIGAMVLCSRAALHAGAGLVTAFVPGCGYTALQSAVPEVMVLTDENERQLTSFSIDFEPQAIAIGPGMGQEPATQRALHRFLLHNKLPLVLDADALNILSKNPTWLGLLPAGTILTPHPKELARLTGPCSSEEETIQQTLALAQRYGLVIVKKGAPSQIVHNGQIFENTTGNQALATAGSGDVLTGIITGLRAQGYAPVHAAQLGVYLHGLTADLALPQTGHESFVASDIIHWLGPAFLTLKPKGAGIGFK